MSTNFFTARGGRGNEGTVQIDGMNVGSAFNGGGVAGFGYPIGESSEIQVTIAGGLGEIDRGGPQFNLIPKTGGNTFSGTAFLSTAGKWSQGDNLDDQLRSYGLTNVPALIKNWDTNFALGGPIIKDRLWFFNNVRSYGNQQEIPGLFGNLNAGNQASWNYQRDESLPARAAAAKMIEAIRLTGQVTPRHKVGFYLDYQQVCNGSAFTQGRRAVPRPRRGLGRARQRRRRLLRRARTRGRQRLGQPREDHAGLVDVAVHEQAAVRGWSLAVRQPVRRTDPRRRADRFHSRAGAGLEPDDRHAGRQLHLSRLGLGGLERAGAQRLARVGEPTSPDRTA